METSYVKLDDGREVHFLSGLGRINEKLAGEGRALLGFLKPNIVLMQGREEGPPQGPHCCLPQAQSSA